MLTLANQMTLITEDIGKLNQVIFVLEQKIESLEQNLNNKEYSIEQTQAQNTLTEEEQALQVLTRIDDTFNSQDIDPSWAIDEEEKILEAFDSLELTEETQIINNTCKQSVCRLEVIHNNPEAQFTFEQIRNHQDMSYYLQSIDNGEKTIAYFFETVMKVIFLKQ